MPQANAHAILIANAAVYAVLGVALLLSPASGFFEALGLPEPDPGVFAQLAGGAFLILAVLAWEAPSDPVLERHIGRAIAGANLLSALLLVLALAANDIDATNTGKGVLWLTAVALAGLGALEARYLRAG